jgi:hypothetical protein
VAGRAARGGEWTTEAFHARSAYRSFISTERREGLGIRVCAPAPGSFTSRP